MSKIKDFDTNIGCDYFHDCVGCRYYYDCPKNISKIEDIVVNNKNVGELKKVFAITNEQLKIIKGL